MALRQVARIAWNERDRHARRAYRDHGDVLRIRANGTPRARPLKVPSALSVNPVAWPRRARPSWRPSGEADPAPDSSQPASSVSAERDRGRKIGPRH